MSEINEAGQVTQYIGARYVPLFATPLEWSDDREYEPLTIVQYQGDSYTSRQFVPKGIRIADAEYWAITGNYNAQIEQYRDEVKTFDARITANTEAIKNSAPKMHSSADTTYGVGNATNYGHVKIADSGASAAASGVAASPKMVTEVRDNTYTKQQADALFTRKIVDNDTSILGCIGDSILAGWSNEHPNNIPAWDKYLGESLGFDAANVYKQGIGGSGFDSNTTFTTEVGQLKEKIIAAGRDVADVKLIVIGGGINDVTNQKTRARVLEAATDCVNATASAFPNAEIHVFPMVMGWKGLCSLLMELESAVIDGAMMCRKDYRNRVRVHSGCWSWNYDGNDTGVSNDGIHLLENGMIRVGVSMANEINGGSSYRKGYKFEITNAQGTKVATGHRRDACVYFKLSTNLTTITVNSKFAALGMHPRYCARDMCLNFSQPDETKNVIMFGDDKTGFFNSYKALNNTGCYGGAAYSIEFPSYA